MTKDRLSTAKRGNNRRSVYLVFGAMLTVAMAAFPVIFSVKAERSSTSNVGPAMLVPCTPVSFSNTNAISIPVAAAGTANPYPSSIAVSGRPGNIVAAAGGVEVTLNGFSHTWSDDIAIVLVGPTGAALLLQDGAGDDPDMTNITYKISDLGSNPLPNATAWPAGTYRPTTYYEPSAFPPPGPGSNYQLPANAGNATFASVFGNTAPNGTWSLFIQDFSSGDGGQLAGGWTLTLTTEGCDGSSPSPSPSASTSPSPSPSTTPVNGTITVTGTNLGAIPDNSCTGTGRQVQFAVSGLTGPISNIRVAFTGTHTYVGDLDVLLVAPNEATAQDIFTFTGNNVDPQAGDGSDLNGTYTFFDTATTNWWSAAAAVDASTAIPSGNYRASDPSGANVSLDPVFANLANPNGVWVLKFNDCSSSDTGSITAATLMITGTDPNQVPATLDISGKVLSSAGLGIKGALVTITGPAGFKRTVFTSTLGYYRFESVPTGVTYTITVNGKRYTFTPKTVPLTSAAASQQDFVGQPVTEAP